MTETVGDVLKALVRTVVPAVVGLVLSYLAQAGLQLDAATAESVTLLFATIFTASYYALVRALSQRWAWFGWLLGYPTNPTYEPRHGE
ncbi:hypothetical protein [Leucobacter luti]|uniref:Uncharacterized protein n=1 Tax=Leucobacter luti TaxID=340320 RepID=A0A4Q7U0G4_9MICO|nr:hypothetical protein [Leucobacter luti]MBL3699223.1 hypothetical protein [Leucobacter luti]RZT66723.1 hypothetical protein EV139_0850 [Leucobacter luti]